MKGKEMTPEELQLVHSVIGEAVTKIVAESVGPLAGAVARSREQAERNQQRLLELHRVVTRLVEAQHGTIRREGN
ncbi:hypothetical protein [Mesorhizobium sp. IMUNJ 23232]|uniref:hypothetical protein n=1 Tax=Mesorhizobium sp. IMUNJ 23232 TaxID=3376064 RepID=UPI00378CA6E6